MKPSSEPPIDEIQWSSREALMMEFGGLIHHNNVLYYFALSPFFDRQCNNELVFNQASRDVNQHHIIETRDAFEERLRQMQGLEYVIAEGPPKDTHQDTWSNIWVIRKQMRHAGNKVEALADYFIVGENVYMAPTFADILSSRIATISSTIAKIFPAVDSIQRWSPALGQGYKTPGTAPASSGPRQAAARGLESKEATPMPDGLGAASNGAPARKQASAVASAPDARLVEESFAIHLRFGGEYMDENPITGKPGEFLLSTTGRKDAGKHPLLAGGGGQPALPLLKTTGPNDNSSPLNKEGAGGGKEGKAGKSGSGGPPKPKRRKSKGGTTPS